MWARNGRVVARLGVINIYGGHGLVYGITN